MAQKLESTINKPLRRRGVMAKLVSVGMFVVGAESIGFGVLATLPYNAEYGILSTVGINAMYAGAASIMFGAGYFIYKQGSKDLNDSKITKK